MLFIGSRGCAFHCTYCCNRKLKELYAGAGNYIRRMSFEKYVEHLETLYTRHFPDTIRLLAKLAYPYYAQMYNLVFFPGSALYERAVRDHIIAGREDSGAELHFRGGFKYESHAWKQKNLYLNALLFLAEGKATRARVGFLPRPLIPLLTHPIVVRRLRRRSIPALSKTVIAVKMAALALRARIGGLLKQAIGDPAAVYDLWGYFLRKARRHSDSSVRATSRPAVSGGFR